MKKALLFASIAVLAGGILAGCGSKADEDSSNTVKGPVLPESQLGQAGGKGNGPGQKGDFKPLPTSPDGK